MASVMFSLEMSKTEIVMRLLSAEAKIKLGDMRSGKMTDDDWTKLARRMSEISEAPLFIDDSPNLTMMEIRAKARRLKQKHDIKLIVIDYLQLMSSGKKVESRQQEVSEFSRSLKLLAKELEVPVVAICQLNRGPEQRQDKRPQVADLRESGSLEQDADMVILLYRPDATERDDPRGGEADLILGKHRNGPTATITVAHQLHLSKFVDMARGSFATVPAACLLAAAAPLSSCARPVACPDARPTGRFGDRLVGPKKRFLMMRRRARRCPRVTKPAPVIQVTAGGRVCARRHPIQGHMSREGRQAQ